jgi:hypothetical protein
MRGVEMGEAIVSTRIGEKGPIVQLEVGGSVTAEEDVSAFSKVVPFDSVVDSVAAVSQAMTDALRRARPNEAEITFGLDVALEAGQLTSLIVKGSGTATFAIRLLWTASTDQQRSV